MTYVLRQIGTDPFCLRFEDMEGRAAFSIDTVAQGNLIVKLNRQDDWALQHPDIMGPRAAYFYFGPNNAPGHLAYGGAETAGMSVYLRRKKDSSSSRYFFAQNGKEWKWKVVSAQRMECCDARTVIAVWEASEPGSSYEARITLTHTGLTIVTEVMATLTLNLIAKKLNW